MCRLRHTRKMSKLYSSLWRTTRMKTILFFAMAMAMYFCLGMLFPLSNHTALIVLVLGTWAISFKALAAVATFGLLKRSA
jgi:glucan phosphoethanolaminetransferase (alkaline phosphatase superfamily)